MKLRNVLLAATILAAPVAVKAQPVSGLYVGAGAGVNYLQAVKVKSVTIGTTSTANPYRLRDDGGYVVVGSIGYGLGNGLRFEVEGNYRNEHIRFKDGAGSQGRGGGNLLAYGPMFNVLYDLPIAFPVTPYVGVGAGYGLTQFQNVRSTALGGTPFVNYNNSSKGSIAGQAILGVAYNIPPVPGLALTAEYRFYVDAQSERFKGIQAGTGTASSMKIGTEYNHALMLGVRYAFNAAPLAPAPLAPIVSTPPTAPSRTYLVFFDWDRSDLTARARQIIAQAADNSTHVQYTRMEVNGYTDLSGTAQYNQGLSVRRAESVAAELVKDGVPRSNITIQGFGETHPLVPTANGVREPQNRRVEIILR